jgi:Ca2+-binding EF-hand superfamily protein
MFDGLDSDLSSLPFTVGYEILLEGVKNDLEGRALVQTMSDDSWDTSQAMQKLQDALNEKGMTVDELFDHFDADSDGTINGPELHNGIKDMVGDVLSPGQISMIIKAFDVNEDHRIDLAELKTAMDSEE